MRVDQDAPKPRPGEALIRVHIAGICATDLELTRGYASFVGVPGHEFVGHVVFCPDAPEWTGARVVGEINLPCRQCPTCRAGRERHCPHRTVLGIVGHPGAFAEELTLPIENLHRVPVGMPDDVAVFCEPLAAALEVTDQVHIRPTSRVLLVGAGRLGQLIARVLHRTGCELTVVARHDGQRRLLESAAIASCAPADVNGLEPFDVVVEASGSPGGFEMARRLVRPAGTLVLKSTYAGRLEVDASALVVDEITVVGSRCGPFDAAMRLLGRGVVEPETMIEARYPLEEAEAAFERARGPAARKVLISINE